MSCKFKCFPCKLMWFCAKISDFKIKHSYILVWLSNGRKKLTLLCLHGFVGVRVFGLCEFFILHHNITKSRVYISNLPIDRRSLQNDSFWNSSVDTSDKCKYLNLILATIRIFPLHRQFKIIKALLLLMYLRALTEFVYFSRSHVRLLPLFLSHARYLPLSC